MMIGLLTCTYSMRQLTRLVEQLHPSTLHEPLRTTLKHISEQISATIKTVSTALDTHQPPSVQTAEDQLATAEDTIRQQYRQEEQQRLLGVVHALRSLDQALVGLADGDLPILERKK
jgi:replicative DNA helicase